MNVHWNIINRPIKIGFLVREWETQDIKKVSFVNTILWWWMYNPIIPISQDDNSFAIDLLKLYEVDCVYPLENSKEITEFVWELPNLSMWKFRLKDLFTSDMNTNYLDLYDLAVSVYKEDFKHKPTWYKSNFTNLSWSISDTDDILKGVFFWLLNHESIETLHDYSSEYDKFLFSNNKNISGSFNIWDIYDFLTPISISWMYLDYQLWWNIANVWVYIWDHTSFIDLLNFWNLRALWNDIIFQPIGLDNYLWYTQKYIDNISKTIDKSSHDAIYFYHSLDSYSKVEVEQTVEKLNVPCRMVYHCISSISYSGMNLLLQRQYSKISKASIWYIEEMSDFNLITLPILNDKIFDEISNNKCIVYSVSTLLYWKYDNSIVNLPIHDGLNEFYKKELFSCDLLKPSREGLDILKELESSYIKIKSFKFNEIINEVFKLSWCVKIELSKSWIQTKKILEQMDYESRGLFWSKVFKISTVRKLINSMKSSDSTTRSNATNIINSNWEFSRFKSLYIERRDCPDLSPNAVFDYLLTHNILRPWLEMKCKECWLKNWLSLKKIDEMLECEYCWYNQIISTSLWSRNEWKFRLSWLFSKDNNQEWAIPVILTLITFESILDKGFIYDLSLNLDYWWSNKCETDIVILNQEEWLWMVMNNKITIEIWIGEIKTKWNIEQNDIDNLKYVRERLINQWFVPYLIFVKTAEAFTEDEIEIFKELRRENVDIILFTNNELEKDDFIYTDLDVPNKYASNLLELSQNSVKLYL